jgi:hypothetical protein
MLKKLMITTALTGLMIGTAAAQGTGTPQNPAGAPAAKSAPMSTPAPSASAPAPSASSAKFINLQQPDQYLASKFKGTDVLGADNQKIGDVSDILFAKDGKVLAYVVSVGGFLGLGSKNVALEPTAFQVVAGDKFKSESDKLRLSMTKDQLKQAANFEPYKAPSSTTGLGSSGTRPSSPARPVPAVPR